MEEKLINAVKSHNILYNKTLLLYRNKYKRAAAWKEISKEINLPENVCQARWKSLRDKFVKRVAESHRASGSGAEITETPWIYQKHMEFLREHVKQRRTVTSSTLSQNLEESCMGASPTYPLEDDPFQSIEYLTDVEFCEELPSVSTPIASSESSSPLLNSSRKRPRRDCDSEVFTEFLNKMKKIAETRFAVPSASKESGGHDGFFSMVREIFDELPDEGVRNAKFFILNYLRDQLQATKEC